VSVACVPPMLPLHTHGTAPHIAGHGSRVIAVHAAVIALLSFILLLYPLVGIF